MEEIKQSNLALLEEVEKKTGEFPQIFGMDLIVSEDIKIDVGAYKAGYNRALDDFKSTLSKHKERLNHIHQDDGNAYLSNPPQYKCKDCGEFFKRG
jgi:hypothetical protein